MKRHSRAPRPFFRSPLFLPAAVLSVCFFAGGVVGIFLASCVGEAGGDSLSAYIRAYLEACCAGYLDPPSLPTLAWEQLRFSLAAVILGMTALGVAGIPALFAVRGFLLGFSSAAFVRMFGVWGAGLSAILIGSTAFLSVPVLFILGVQGVRAAYFAGKREPPEKGGGAALRRRALCYGCCLAALGLCLCIQRFLTPLLLQALGNFISAV